MRVLVRNSRRRLGSCVGVLAEPARGGGTEQEEGACNVAQGRGVKGVQATVSPLRRRLYQSLRFRARGLALDYALVMRLRSWTKYTGDP